MGEGTHPESEGLTFAKRFFNVVDMRFWHVLGYVGGKFPAMLPLLDTTDRVLEKIQYVNRMAWMFTFCLERPASS